MKLCYRLEYCQSVVPKIFIAATCVLSVKTKKMRFYSIFHNSGITNGASWPRRTDDLPEELKMNKECPKMSG